MGLNWSEDELRLKGYTEGPDGVYRRAGENTSLSRTKVTRNNNSRKVSKLKQGLLVEETGSNGTKKGTERVSEEGNQFTLIIDSYRKRHMDPDNLCPKWYIDEIVEAGIMPDDLSRYVVEVRKRVHKTKGDEYTKVTVIKWQP
jgi:hypothetical protein